MPCSGRDFNMCLSISWIPIFCLTQQKNPSLVLATSRPDMEPVPCSNSEEEKPFLWTIKKFGRKGPPGLPGPMSCPKQGCLRGWSRLHRFCLDEFCKSPRPVTPQQILSLGMFSALPRLIKCRKHLFECIWFMFLPFLSCCALIWLESNPHLVEVSATPLFSKNFHWHQEIFVLSCCHWTKADVIVLRISGHSLPPLCVKPASLALKLGTGIESDSGHLVKSCSVLSEVSGKILSGY